MQCACAVLPSVPCPALKRFFPTLSHKLHDFQRKKKPLNTKCVFWFSVQLLSQTFLILRIHWDVDVRSFPCKGPVIIVTFYWKLNFLGRFSKNTPISNLTKIRPVGPSCSVQTDRHGESSGLFFFFFAIMRTRLKPSQLMLYREIIAVCSESHTKHINTVCGQNVEFYLNQNYI